MGKVEKVSRPAVQQQQNTGSFFKKPAEPFFRHTGQQRTLANTVQKKDDPETFKPTIKLTGSTNLLIFIQDGEAVMDEAKMKETSGAWDYIVVQNMNQAEQILKKAYGDKKGFLNNLVIKSHGSAAGTGHAGPDLNTASGVGVVNNPSGDKSLQYIRTLLSNSANVLMTACSVIQGCGNPMDKKGKEGASVLDNFTKFWLSGTRRNLFMNNTLSHSWNYTDNDNSKSLSKGDDYWFLFDSPLIESDKKKQWSGYVWQYYGSDGKPLRQKFYYQIEVNSEGKLDVTKMMPINSAEVAPNAEKPRKKNL